MNPLTELESSSKIAGSKRKLFADLLKSEGIDYSQESNIRPRESNAQLPRRLPRKIS